MNVWNRKIYHLFTETAHCSLSWYFESSLHLHIFLSFYTVHLQCALFPLRFWTKMLVFLILTTYATYLIQTSSCGCLWICSCHSFLCNQNITLDSCCSSPSSVCLLSWELENKFHPWMLSYYRICTSSLYNNTICDLNYIALNYGMVMDNELEGSGCSLIWNTIQRFTGITKEKHKTLNWDSLYRGRVSYLARPKSGTLPGEPVRSIRTCKIAILLYCFL